MNAQLSTWRPEEKPPAPIMRYDFVPCFVCQGSGQSSWIFHGSEMIESCRPCNGRGAVTVERYE